MSGIFRACMATLPPAQKDLWPELESAAKMGFVLYGGTAIALRLGHRTSVDFDFFTDLDLHRKTLTQNMPFLQRSSLVQDEKNALTFLVPDRAGTGAHVKLSFFGAIAFGRIGEPNVTDDGVLQVASLDDLMATKVKVILQRAEAKDYQDIAAMIRAGVRLDKGLAAASAFYGPNFQPSESLRALVFFEDGDLNQLGAEDRQTLVTAATSVRELPILKIASRRLMNFSQNTTQHA